MIAIPTFLGIIPLLPRRFGYVSGTDKCLITFCFYFADQALSQPSSQSFPTQPTRQLYSPLALTPAAFLPSDAKQSSSVYSPHV